MRLISYILTFITSIATYFWILPAFNLTDYNFYFWIGLNLIIYCLLYSGLNTFLKSTDFFDNAKELKIPLTILASITTFCLLVGIATRPLFFAKGYSNVTKIENKDFKKDFPNTDINKLSLLDKTSASKIGNSLMGSIDKESQFEDSKEYRQITINNEPYRVSPLKYSSFFRWISNRKDGIQYYIKVNQTTGKGELVKLSNGMKYTQSAFMFDNVSVKLRLTYPTKIFSDPSFEVDDKGNPYYVATTYKRLFGFGSKDPNGVVLLNAITGESKEYSLKNVPKWVDRVYSADNVLERVSEHYKYAHGFWNSVLGKVGLRQTTDEYNYISIGSDIYLYTGLTSVNSDTSNLGFVLVNMRTREINFYKLPSVTESTAMKAAKGAVQEKRYKALAPILTKLNNKSYYLVSLVDDASIVKSYALINAEDFQQVTVNSNINDLIKSVTGEEIQNLDQSVSGKEEKPKQKIEGIIINIKSQVVDGTTIYYLKINNSIYKIEANKNTLDQLPFLEINQTISAEVDENNFLNNIKFN